MIFELIGGLLEWGVDALSELFGEAGGELIAGGAEALVDLGTAVVAIGAGAAALGAIIALAELTVDSIRKYLNNKNIASQIEDILNNDKQTQKYFRDKLQNVPQFSLKQMNKVVAKMQRTSDGQTVATVRVIHPESKVYTDIPIAGNKVSGVYEGLTL